ncbi:MAG: hypothetical protein JXJ20_07415 [Anaerolineae bacterium]|nr:hypothetical protein [Anaerolineae bacterium]
MRRLILVGLTGCLILGMLLAGCNGDDDGAKNGGGDQPTADVRATGPTSTPRPPAPRNRSLPSGDPYDFEAPFSVSEYVRESTRGHVTSHATGGLQASYRNNGAIVALTVYHFETLEQAAETARFTLDSASLTGFVEEVYDSPTVVYAIAQDRHGGYVAVWTHYEWVYIAQTPDDLDGLRAFMEAFPY